MKRRRHPWLIRGSLIGIFLGSFMAVEIPFAQSEKSTAKAQKPGTFRLNVTEGHLSLEANHAPVAKIFEEMGKQAGIMVEGSLGPAETITMRLDKVPLEEGIKRLSNNVTILYGAKPNEKGHRITKIVVLSEDKRKVTRSEDTTTPIEKPTQKAAVQKASKASAPTQPREPFKFEFDPTKAMTK